MSGREATARRLGSGVPVEKAKWETSNRLPDKMGEYALDEKNPPILYQFGK